MRVQFSFDKEKDIWNTWSRANNTMKRFSESSISPKIIEVAKDKSIEVATAELTKINQTIYNSGMIESFIEILEKIWRGVEDKFFERLAEITGKEFLGNVTCFVTLMGSCPYNIDERWFMTSIYYDIPKAIVSIGHELLHIHFHDYYFKDIEKTIGTDKTHDLREALTVLLNLEFRDLLIGFDKGYEVHKELRDFIKTAWIEEKNFDNLLNRCITHLPN